MSEPPRPAWTRVAAVFGALLASLYILNPTSGLIEIIPDVIPIVGNLDEAAATGLLLYCLRILFGRDGGLAP